MLQNKRHVLCIVVGLIECVVYVCVNQYFESTLGLSPGDSVLFINGLQVDLDINDVFTLVELLRSESNMMDGLHSLAEQYQLDPDITQQLLKLDLRDSETMYAVDIRDPSVIVRLALYSVSSSSSLSSSLPSSSSWPRSNCSRRTDAVEPAVASAFVAAVQTS